MFDIESVRADFPVLNQELYGHPLLYFDNAATMQMPEPVLDAISRHYHYDNANVHRGIHTLSERSTAALEEARRTVARFINAKSPDEIIFTSGTTGSINLLADIWDSAPTYVSKGAIAVTMMEHHANFVPWQQLCRRSGRGFLTVPLDADGDLDLLALDELLSSNEVSLLALTHVSNVLGTVNPIAGIVEMAHDYGALVLVDAAQSIRHEAVDVQDLGCDFLAFSGHKIGGPTGIGVLYGRADLLDMFTPARFGGEMVEDVRVEWASFADVPIRFEAGTPNYVGAIGLAAALDYIEKVGRADIAAYEHELVEHIERALGEIEGVRVLGNPCARSGCVSFTVDGVHPFDLAIFADKLGLALRSGNQCAQPLLYEAYDVQRVSRLSPAFYTTHDEVDQAIAVLQQVVSLLRNASCHEVSEQPETQRQSSCPVYEKPSVPQGDESGRYRWEWIEYPHGNQELVERRTDACLEQMNNDSENRARFLLSLRNADNSQNHWCIVLENDADPNWFETLKSHANMILDNPEAYAQFDL